MRKTEAHQRKWGQQKPMSPKSTREAALLQLQGRTLVDRALVIKVLDKLVPLSRPLPLHSVQALGLMIEPGVSDGKKEVQGPGSSLHPHHLSMVGRGSSPYTEQECWEARLRALQPLPHLLWSPLLQRIVQRIVPGLESHSKHHFPHSLCRKSASPCCQQSSLFR